MNDSKAPTSAPPSVLYPDIEVTWPELPGIVLACLIGLILLSFLRFPIRHWRQRRR